MRKLTTGELLTSKHFRIDRDLVVLNNTDKYLVFNQPERGFARVDQFAVIAPEFSVPTSALVPNSLANIPLTNFRIYNGNSLKLPYDKYLANWPGIGVAQVPNGAFNDEYLCQMVNPMEFDDHIFLEFPNYIFTGYNLFPMPVRVIMSGMIYILGIEEPFEDKSDVTRITSGEGKSVEKDFQHPPDEIIEGIR